MTNPILPSLPLEDGVFFIDNSRLELLQTCPRQFQYSALQKRITSGEKPAMDFGSAGHLVWEYRYKTYQHRAPDNMLEDAQGKLLQEYFDKTIFPEGDFRNLNWGVECLVKQYNKRYKEEPFRLLQDENGKPMVELPFALPLFTYITPSPMEGYIKEIPIMYTGRIDLPVHWDSGIWIIDHKTTSILGDHFYADQRISPQQIGYCWAFQELTKQKVSGFCINAIRVKQPPLYVQKNEDAFNALTGKVDKRRKNDSPEAWWEESFSRQVREYIQPWQIEEWKHNTIQLVEEFFYNYSRGYMPQKKKWCCGKYGKCQYYDVCDLPPGEQRDGMLASGGYMENVWSPLRKL